jgi:hypothetical protein
MANLEKHKKNPLRDWIDEDEGTVPAQSRSPHVVGAYIKIAKPETRKARRPAANGVTQKVEPALMREPSPPPKVEDKHSQASSPEHLRKLQRLPKLRASYAQRPGSRP